MISRYHGMANSLRARITKQRAMEAISDAGLEDKCVALQV